MNKVAEALRARFAHAAWAFFAEVRSATGFAKNLRIADAVAMSVWPSRGLELHGFEIKMSRGDWLGELKTPEKAEGILRYMDRWWVATIPGVVEVGELPPTWGLLVLKGTRMVVETDAPKIEPIPIDRQFLASLLRASSEVDRRTVAAMIEERSEALATGRIEVMKQLFDQERRDREQLERRFKVFLEAAGLGAYSLDILRWDHGVKIGDAVRLVLSGDAKVSGVRHDLESLRERAARVLAGIDSALSNESPA